MKKILFYAITATILLVAVFTLISFFLRWHTLVVYKKYPTPRFIKFIAQSKIIGIDKNYQLPPMKTGAAFDERKPHPYCGFKTEAAVKMSDAFYINSLGHKSPQLGKKEKGVIRIAMVGGSTAFGFCDNDQTIIAQLADLLRRRGSKVEYINAAVLSSISNQELSTVVHDLLDLDVDLLISFDGYNDISHPLFYNGRIGWPPFRWDTTKGMVIEKNKQTAPSYYPPIEPLGGDPKEEELEAITKNYLNNINKIAAICKTFHITYIAILQSLKDFNTRPCSGSAPLMPEQLFYCTIISAFERWDLERKAGATYVSFADQLPANFFSDYCHFTEEGNGIIAEKILGIITARKLLPR